MVMLDNFDWSTSDIDIPVIITPILLDYLSPKRSSIDGGVVTSVYGEDFNGTCSVYFDGVESSQTTFVDSTELQAVAPPHPEGIIDVDVICDGVEGTLSNSFTYFEDFDGALPPSISTVTPYQIVANGGDEIQVVGSDFISGASVEIDGVAVASTFVSDQLLTFIAPAHSEGFANILVRNPDGLYDELSGALYYTPSVAEPEAETTEPSSEEGEEGEEGNEVDGSEGPKGGTTGGCAHVSSPKEGLGFILMILGVLAWRKK
jgi:hypothetical protein